MMRKHKPNYIIAVLIATFIVVPALGACHNTETGENGRNTVLPPVEESMIANSGAESQKAIITTQEAVDFETESVPNSEPVPAINEKENGTEKDESLLNHKDIRAGNNEGTDNDKEDTANDGNIHKEKGDKSEFAGTESNTAIGSLEGKIICVDPGHGNPSIKGKKEKNAPNSDITKDSIVYGASGKETKTPEYAINMTVDLLLVELLTEQGGTVVLTRKNDEENLGNIQRAQIGNYCDADLVIRIHADGSANPDAKGISVLYPGEKYISDADLLSKSKLAAQTVHDALIKATGSKTQGLVKREDLTGFNWSTKTVILVEMGFLTNAAEEALLINPAYQEKIADGMVNGIIQYFYQLDQGDKTFPGNKTQSD